MVHGKYNLSLVTHSQILIMFCTFQGSSGFIVPPHSQQLVAAPVTMSQTGGPVQLATPGHEVFAVQPAAPIHSRYGNTQSQPD